MSYPNHQLLVTVEWLHEHLQDAACALLDVRASNGWAAYEQGHIPGALPFSLAHAQGMVGDTPDGLLEGALSEQLGALGITPDQTVVLYDSGYTTTLTQSFWALERVGQASVRVLEGGLTAWLAAGGALSQAVPSGSAVPYHAPHRECLAEASWLVAHGGEAALVDARGPQEWRAARIAGSINLPWTLLTCGDAEHTPLPTEALQTTLAAHGLAPERETVTYCRTGGRASFVYFTLRLMGWERVRHYDGSMSDWLLRELPVAP